MGWLGRKRKPGELTQVQVARILGCSQATVSNLLRKGKLGDLQPETVAKFAKTYQPISGARQRGALTYAQAARIIGCTEVNLDKLVYRGRLANLQSETVKAFAQTYQRYGRSKPSGRPEEAL